MELLVFGAGSLGSLLGGLLAREHEVTLVGRKAHMDAVEANGLTIDGLLDERIHPRAVTDVSGLSADVALVTVKSYDTATAADELSGADIDAVCSLQNGLGNEEILAEALSCPVLGGSVTYGAELVDAGLVRMTGQGTVTIGSFTDGDELLLQSVVDAFLASDVDAQHTDDIERTLWHKAAINAAINPVATLARSRNGALVDGPLAEIAEQAALEVAAVAQEHGVDLDDGEMRSAVYEVASATAENRCSMLQDVLNGKRTEIDAINGAIVDRARTSAVPVNSTLASLMRGLERSDLEVA